jgi:hypothetical protein
MRACSSTYFLFTTGIENSAPRVHGRRVRVDQMALCRHYDLWRTDFDLVEEIGVNHLQYDVTLYSVWRGPGWYDWSFTDDAFGDPYRRDLTPIVDLCHFSVPDGSATSRTRTSSRCSHAMRATSRCVSRGCSSTVR